MFFVGVDLGQKRDHAAIAVVEREPGEEAVRVRHLERMALGTPYPRVVTRVRELVQENRLQGNARWQSMARAWAHRWWICCVSRIWAANWRRSRSAGASTKA